MSCSFSYSLVVYCSSVSRSLKFVSLLELELDSGYGQVSQQLWLRDCITCIYMIEDLCNVLLNKVYHNFFMVSKLQAPTSRDPWRLFYGYFKPYTSTNLHVYTSNTSSSSHSSASPTNLTLLISNLNASVPIKLGSTNYIVWKSQLHNILKATKLLGFVNGIQRYVPHLLSS